MAKYIDREALVEWLKRIPLKDLSDGRGLCRVIFEDDFKRAIKKIPKGIIVDVAQVRHGYWRPILHVGGKTDYECSCCLGIIADVPDDDEHDLCAWCSMCGAKMDGGED